jgi:hypothetical protein
MAEIKTIPEMIADISPYYKDKKGKPESQHKIVYESYTETLEPVYYFLLDLMEDFGLGPEKLIDNFSPTPGSTQFGELGTRATAMQQQASKVLGDINTVLRSVLNIIYDLRDFQMRLQDYDNIHSSKTEVQDAARLALKQLWMDKVDMQKGNSSIKALATQGGFITLIDAFLAAKDIKGAEKLDLNDRIKRILIPRLQEFETWLGASEQELRKRFEIEKHYLRSQVNSMRLYSRWAKPYLIAAQQLETKPSTRAALVKAFNRTILEMTLLGKHTLNPKDLAIAKKLPDLFMEDKNLRKLKREYHPCILIDFLFTAVPKQGTYIGKAEVTFSSYALNNEEVAKLKDQIEKEDIGDVLNLIEGATEESINQLKDDINTFLEGDILGPSEKPEEKKPDESNPFLAIVGAYDREKKSGKPVEKVKPDNFIEATHLRTYAAESAKDILFNLFDIYKKAHQMPSYT